LPSNFVNIGLDSVVYDPFLFVTCYWLHSQTTNQNEKGQKKAEQVDPIKRSGIFEQCNVVSVRLMNMTQ